MASIARVLSPYARRAVVKWGTTGRRRFSSNVGAEKPVAFRQWINDVAPDLKPPVSNRMLYDASLKLMVVGGPNQRRDYHLQWGEELFIMLRGSMVLDVVEQGNFRSIEIPEGHMFLLPPRIPHSPQRPADSIGLVVERAHPKHEMDGMQWFHGPRRPGEPRTAVEYEEYFFCENLGTQLAPIIKRYNARSPGDPPVTVSQPPITADSDVKIGPVLDIRPLLNMSDTDALPPRSNLVNGEEVSVDVISTKEAQLLKSIKDDPDTLIWQLDGGSVVQREYDGAGASDRLALREGDMFLARGPGTHKLSSEGNSVSLVICNKRAKTNV